MAGDVVSVSRFSMKRGAEAAVRLDNCTFRFGICVVTTAIKTIPIALVVIIDSGRYIFMGNKGYVLTNWTWRVLNPYCAHKYNFVKSGSAIFDYMLRLPVWLVLIWTKPTIKPQQQAPDDSENGVELGIKNDLRQGSGTSPGAPTSIPPGTAPEPQLDPEARGLAELREANLEALAARQKEIEGLRAQVAANDEKAKRAVARVEELNQALTDSAEQVAKLTGLGVEVTAKHGAELERIRGELKAVQEAEASARQTVEELKRRLTEEAASFNAQISTLAEKERAARDAQSQAEARVTSLSAELQSKSAEFEAAKKSYEDDVRKVKAEAEDDLNHGPEQKAHEPADGAPAEGEASTDSAPAANEKAGAVANSGDELALQLKDLDGARGAGQGKAKAKPGAAATYAPATRARREKAGHNPRFDSPAKAPITVGRPLRYMSKAAVMLEIAKLESELSSKTSGTTAYRRISSRLSKLREKLAMLSAKK